MTRMVIRDHFSSEDKKKEESKPIPLYIEAIPPEPPKLDDCKTQEETMVIIQVFGSD
jgi:hypothetical protein